MKWIKTLTHDGEVCSAWCGVCSTGEMSSWYRVGRWLLVIVSVMGRRVDVVKECSVRRYCR